MKASVITSKVGKKPFAFKTDLKVGDSVMVMTGGNKTKGKVLKGQVGTIKKFLPKSNRVIVEGLNIVSRHKRASNTQEESTIIKKEGSIDISNIMYYSDKHKRPFRLSVRRTDAGDRERGVINPESGEFEAV